MIARATDSQEIAKQGSRKASISFSWPALLFLAATISMSFLSGCSGLVTANNSVAPPPTSFNVSPSSLNFGSVASGSKTSLTATVTNTGTKAITISQATFTNNEFTLSNLSLPAALPAGQSANFLVWLNGTTVGSATGTLTLSASDGTASAPVTLSGTVLSPQPKLSVSPLSVNFGSVTVGSKGVQTVTLSNQGAGDLVISQIAVSVTPVVASGVQTPATIKGAQSAILTLTYSPTTAGQLTGSVTITSNDPQAPTTAIQVSGTATAAPVPPTITTQPANQTVTAGQMATFTVVAAGTTPLSYQWQKNGLNIAGATLASYTTAATTVSDSGSTFDVVVSNTAGTVTSTAATLTVNAPVQHTVTLNWTASTSIVVGYNVYRSTVSGGPYTRLNGSFVSAVTYTDSTVLSAQTYYYVTSAVDANSIESIYSNEVSAVIP